MTVIDFYDGSETDLGAFYSLLFIDKTWIRRRIDSVELLDLNRVRRKRTLEIDLNALRALVARSEVVLPQAGKFIIPVDISRRNLLQEVSVTDGRGNILPLLVSTEEAHMWTLLLFHTATHVCKFANCLSEERKASYLAQIGDNKFRNQLHDIIDNILPCDMLGLRRNQIGNNFQCPDLDKRIEEFLNKRGEVEFVSLWCFLLSKSNFHKLFCYSLVNHIPAVKIDSEGESVFIEATWLEDIDIRGLRTVTEEFFQQAELEQENYNKDRENYNKDRENYNKDRENYNKDRENYKSLLGTNLDTSNLLLLQFLLLQFRLLQLRLSRPVSYLMHGGQYILILIQYFYMILRLCVKRIFAASGITPLTVIVNIPLLDNTQHQQIRIHAPEGVELTSIPEISEKAVDTQHTAHIFSAVTTDTMVLHRRTVDQETQPTEKQIRFGNVYIKNRLRPAGQAFSHSLLTVCFVNLAVLFFMTKSFLKLLESFTGESGAIAIESDAVVTVLLVGISLYSAYVIRPGEHALKATILLPVRTVIGATAALSGLIALSIALEHDQVLWIALKLAFFIAKIGFTVAVLFITCKKLDCWAMSFFSGETIDMMNPRRKGIIERALLGFKIIYPIFVICIAIVFLFICPEMRFLEKPPNVDIVPQWLVWMISIL